MEQILQEKPAVIEIRNLCKKYTTMDGEVQALDHVSLTIRKEDIFGVIGMSGAGKTTLVRCMNFLERPSEGNVLIDGEDLGLLSTTGLRKVRQSVSMIFQHFNLLMQQTVENNIRFALDIAGAPKHYADTRIAELLEIVGLPDKARAYPSQLSGGQKQRVAIARALANNPKILLCDEATSALDPVTTRAILALLKDINKRLGITIVIITHEMSVIREVCTRVAVMEGAKIVEEGSVDEVFTRPKTQTARKLFFTGDVEVLQPQGKRYRLVFDEGKLNMPIIAGTINACGTPINILFADVQTINEKAIGQMVIEISADPESVHKALSFLENQHVIVEEV